MSVDHRDPAPFVALVDRWTASLVDENPVVAHVERDPELTRWYVRIRGEERLVTTVWFTVREMTLQYESYFMPAPEENVAQCFEYLLRANQRFFGMRFSIGLEDAVYLTGQLPFSALGGPDATGELDRILGAAYAYSEECFRTAMSIGFASVYHRRQRST